MLSRSRAPTATAKHRRGRPKGDCSWQRLKDEHDTGGRGDAQRDGERVGHGRQPETGEFDAKRGQKPSDLRVSGAARAHSQGA